MAEQYRRLEAEMEKQHDLISVMEQKEELLLGRLASYEKMFGDSSPVNDEGTTRDREALTEVEYELEKALASYHNDKSREDDTRVSTLVNELLGSGELQKALGGEQVSYTRATRIARNLISYYKQHSTSGTSSRILEILAQEGLSRRIANPNLSPWEDEPFSWWSERTEVDTPGSISCRLAQVHSRCNELSAMLEFTR
eukprot:TRINITY_DN7331_c0_g1_i6.p1 TRINITY_DN7331_c0_g1~~TRINITY_DN7331_c0_g1_i6.p1  ORF type:complete len:211 (+),score=49.54 TRINITY_DN7331_c0_g1_i6:42-635(+)